MKKTSAWWVKHYWLMVLLLSWVGLVCAEPVAVDAAWLAKRIDDPGIVLVDMTADPMQYRRFHLPPVTSPPARWFIQTRRA